LRPATRFDDARPCPGRRHHPGVGSRDRRAHARHRRLGDERRV